MPYKFETDKIPMPEGKDRRVKLTPEDKTLILVLYRDGTHSQRSLARQFGVSRRLIQFILDPEKHKRNLELREARGGSKAYYDKDKNRKAMQEHRQYKKSVLAQQ